MNNIDSERLANMREVLQWASEHVVWVGRTSAGWNCTLVNLTCYGGHTLYECLLNAWVDAHPKP